MVRRWDLISIGNLSRNRYWNEQDDHAYRPAICTSTLIRGDGFCLLVDPAYSDADRMTFELDRRTGLRLRDVDTVFLSHDHGDHVAGLRHFPHADWLAADAVARALNISGTFDKRIEPADELLFGCLDVVHAPGHTNELHSLRFDWMGRSVVVAADAVMTSEFWAGKQGYFNSVDFDQAARTIDMLHRIADIIVPGHDNYFLTNP